MTQNKSEKDELIIRGIINLFQKGAKEEALIESERLIEKGCKFPFLFNLNGIINIELNNWDRAKISLNKAINLDQKYVEAYSNLGIVYNNLGDSKKAIEYFSLSIELKKNYSNGYNNLGSVYDDLGKYEEAIKNYSKALEFNPKHIEAQTNLINILNYYHPNNKNLNPIIVANNNLKKINKDFSFTESINIFELANFFKSANKVIQDNIKELTFFETQTFRRNTIDLNCNRHKKVFNEFDAIPKFCFSCFKIQVEPKNIVELFKLFFIFDSLKLDNNNTRKCLVELRPNISGAYKGLIYCSSMDEVNEILINITPILKKCIDNKIKIKTRRGCSEYAVKHEDYKETNKYNSKFMNYKKEWQEKEKIIDKREAKNKKKKRYFKNSLSGLSISDVLVMNNWLNYAKKINDISYKEISEEMFYSDYISKTISKQLDIRMKDFNE